MLKTAIRVVLLGIVLAVINITAESYGVIFPSAMIQVTYNCAIMVAVGLIMWTDKR
jgi:hypothetical protein